eukprot:9232134-Pyramimonas_sp.AAC.1
MPVLDQQPLAKEAMTDRLSLMEPDLGSRNVSSTMVLCSRSAREGLVFSRYTKSLEITSRNVERNRRIASDAERAFATWTIMLVCNLTCRKTVL